MNKDLVTIIKVIDRILDFIFKYIETKKQEVRKAERDEIQKDPVDWFNERYGGGLRDNSPDEREATSPNDTPSDSGSV